MSAKVIRVWRLWIAPLAFLAAIGLALVLVFGGAR